MSAHSRILWIHKKIAANCYPNSTHAVEKFGISQRQAQRDFESLKTDFGAPIKYSSAHRGFFYTAPFELPNSEEEDTEADYIDLVSGVEENFRDNVDELQLRLPYSAQLKIKDKLAVMNLRRFIVNREARDTYNCEFYNIDAFLGLILVLETDITIVKPDWLRERILSAAKRIIKNNETITKEQQ